MKHYNYLYVYEKNFANSIKTKSRMINVITISAIALCIIIMMTCFRYYYYIRRFGNIPSVYNTDLGSDAIAVAIHITPQLATDVTISSFDNRSDQNINHAFLVETTIGSNLIQPIMLIQSNRSLTSETEIRL